MKTAIRVRHKTKRPQHSKGQHRCVVTRNGMPTMLRPLHIAHCGVLNFSGYVIHQLPIPPGDPYVFRSPGRAHRAIARTEALRLEIDGSLHREWLLQEFPALQPFAAPATYAIERRKRKRA